MTSGIAHLNLGSLRTDQGRAAEAREHAEEAFRVAREYFGMTLAIQRELGDRRVEGIVLANLARLDERRGDVETARAGYERALAIHREVGDVHYEAATLTNLAGVLLDRGDRDCARGALAIAESILRGIHARQELASGDPNAARSASPSRARPPASTASRPRTGPR